MNCILHIGCEKTGTTTIQSWLCQNRDLLSRHGIYVPTWIGASGHTRLIWLAKGLRSRGSRWSEVFCGLNNELAGPLIKNQKILFSSEHLQSRLLEVEEIESLRQILHSLGFSKFKIVIYIREQSHAALSLYSTWVKGGYKEPLARLVFSDYYGKVMNHDRSICNWSSVFGHEAITVRLFPTTTCHGIDLIDDFISACDLPPSEDYSSVNAENEKLSPECLEFLLRLNQGSYPWWMICPLPRSEMIAALTGFSVSHPKAYLSQAYRIRTQGFFSVSNEEVRKKFFPNQDSLFGQGSNDALISESESNDSCGGFSRELDNGLINSIENALFPSPMSYRYSLLFLLLYSKLRQQISLLKAAIFNLLKHESKVE